MKDIQNSQRGFTMVEILISLTIMVVLTGVVLANFRNGDRNLALERSAHQLAQDIRKSIELSFRAEQSTACASGSGILSAYGIFFKEADPTTYHVYVNCNGTDKEGYSPNGADADQFIETISLSPEVEIKSVSTGDEWSAAFFPPDPDVFLCGSDPCNGSNLLSSASVTIQLKSDNTKTKTITINARGSIDVD